MRVTSLVDWDLAVATARRLMRPGPAVSPSEAADVVAELRAAVPIAQRHVSGYTGLHLPAGDAAAASAATVVDRVGWVQANVTGFQVALEPLLEKLAARRGSPTGVVHAVGSRVTGFQVGALMAYLASRVLGQYELFLPPGEGAGRLTLVAPNIVEVQRRLDVDPHDFRMWVALHETTHRTQFTAVPWLRAHFAAEVRAFLDASDLDAAALRDRLRAVSGAILDSLRNRRTGEPQPSVIELIQTPAQRAALTRLQALMSLLEGHGDFVMDNVAPDVVPSTPVIRERFDARRGGQGPVDRLIRRLFGLDLKMRQYAEGARFVRHVVGAVGMAGFNVVWRDPDALPTAAEIADPPSWLHRMRAELATVATVDAG
ncbi:MAG: zinc-dependent metalloprotease [Mycobacteriales bacterium]